MEEQNIENRSIGIIASVGSATKCVGANYVGNKAASAHSADRLNAVINSSLSYDALPPYRTSEYGQQALIPPYSLPRVQMEKLED